MLFSIASINLRSATEGAVKEEDKCYFDRDVPNILKERRNGDGSCLNSISFLNSGKWEQEKPFGKKVLRILHE